LYSFLEAQLDREGYLEDIAFNCYDGDFKNSRLAKQYLAQAHAKCIDFQNKGEQMSRDFCNWDMPKRQDHIRVTLEFLTKAIATENLGEFAEVVRFAPEIARIPSTKKDDFDRQVGAEYKAYNDAFKSMLNDFKKCFGAPYCQIQESIDKNKLYLHILADILKRVYGEYSALKRKDNRMDFADLEYYAVKAMQNDAIASELSGSYDYICVDEYQDVNAVQEYILTRLSNGKNLFMVGDVKQSIYQFRMTDPKIFLDKYRQYKKRPQLGRSYSLNSNYRSCKEVIDFVNAVFDVVMTEDMGGIDYKKESRLLQGNKDYDEQDDLPIRIAHFPKDKTDLDVPMPQDGVYSVREDAQEGVTFSSQEGRYIAEQIKSLVGKKQIQVSSPDGGMTYRTVKYSDIALLCAKRSGNVEGIINELKLAGIPVDGSKILKEKNNTCVSLFTSFLRILDNYRQDIPLVEILTSNVFAKFSYKDMTKIKMTYRGEKFFHEAVNKYAKEQDDELANGLKEFFAMLDKYRRIASFISVDGLIRMLIAQFNYREYMTAIDGGIGELAGLESFIQALGGKSYNDSISKFVEAVDATSDFGKVAGEVGYEGECVATNTIHSSKGLEYPIVFIVDAGRQVNLRDLYSAKVLSDKTYGLAIKSINEQDRFYDDSLPSLLLKEVKVKDTVEEFMRLFYVAVTRARNRLYITATGGLSGKTFGEKYVDNPKSMLEWLNDVAIVDNNFTDKYYDYNASAEDTCEEEIHTQERCKRRLVDISSADAFEKALQKQYDFRSSTTLLVKHTVTAVNNDYYNSLYPQTVYEKDNGAEILDAFKDGDFTDEEILDKRNSADEGVAYHRVLECIDYSCFTLDDVIDKIDDMVEQGFLSEEQKALVDPESILECLQSDVMGQARKYPHYREKQFMLNLPANEFLNIDCDDKVLLQGTVDLFVQGGGSGGENILVDFKFSHKSAEQVKKRYAKQLELYAMAIEECLNIKVDKKVIFMLGKNKTIVL
ncbi:MAG: UvrD-helicase domain-containing protein, partial [Clostridia bacterium]|nr:UvrD-helicase domain-containing protein [Clostridia bacterium]